MSKKIIIIAVIGIVIAGVLWYLGHRDAPAPAPAVGNGMLVTSGAGVVGEPRTSDQISAAGGDFGAMLSNLNEIHIDTSLFESAAYRALQDNKIVLTPEPVGRSNPFAPVGVETTTGFSTPLIQTIQPGKVTATGAEFVTQVTLGDSAPVGVVFQYGTSDIYGSKTATTMLTKSAPVIMPVQGLTPATTYIMRVIVTRGGSIVATGTPVTFTTSAAAAPQR